MGFIMHSRASRGCIMELLIGEAEHARPAFLKKRFGFKKSDIFDLEDGLPEEVFPCYTHLEALSRMEFTAEELKRFLMPYIGESIVVSRGVGCSIAPMEHDARLVHEKHALLLSSIAKEADRVTRLFRDEEERIK